MPTLALSMIVKNGGADLRQCLQSTRGVVDQIVVADTGSTDDSREIAREFGAEVVEFPWCNDFAAARNAALLPVTTDWVLVLDADEELDAAASALLPRLLSHREFGGYLLPIRNYLPVRHARMYNNVAVANDGRNPRAAQCPSYTVHYNCRLFRRHAEIFFEGQVHERPEDRIQACGFGIAKSDLLIHHFGQLASAEERLRKHIFYRDLGRAKVEQYPNSAMAWTELGLQEFENFHDLNEATRCLTRAIELDPLRHDAWMFLAMIYAEQGNCVAALAALDHSGHGASGEAMREQLRGDMLHDLGKLAQSRAAYRRALKAAAGDPVLESKLGYVEARIGMKQSGMARMRRAIQSAGEMPELHERLLKACIATDELAQAAQVAEELAERFPAPRSILRAASIHAHLKNLDRAERLLASGQQRFPLATELISALEQIRQHA